MRLLIAEDHVLVAEGIRKLLEPTYEIVGMVQDGHTLLDAIEQHNPDLVVMDISMPSLNGIEAARKISKLPHAPKVLFLTQQTGPQYVQAAFDAGGSGYVLKHVASSELLTAIEEVMQGRFYLTRNSSLPLAAASASSGQKIDPEHALGRGLSPRQREVLQLIAEGKSAKEIAGILHVSAKTVEFHKACIMDKLNLRTTAELTRYAINSGIVQD